MSCRRYSAAEAQTKIGEAFSGISEEMSDVGLAVQRAEDKTAQMQARAGAIDELVASGALTDVSSMGKDNITVELERMASGNDVENQLAALKADFSGHEALHQHFLEESPKYGNDDDLAFAVDDVLCKPIRTDEVLAAPPERQRRGEWLPHAQRRADEVPVLVREVPDQAAAARMIEAIHQVGIAHLPGVASVGLIENRPNSRNVVPGEVFFTVDLRHPDEKVLDKMEAEYQAALPKIAAETGVEIEEKRIWISPAVKFAAPLIDCVREGASQAVPGLTSRTHRVGRAGAPQGPQEASRSAPRGGGSIRPAGGRA